MVFLSRIHSFAPCARPPGPPPRPARTGPGPRRPRVRPSRLPGAGPSPRASPDASRSGPGGPPRLRGARGGASRRRKTFSKARIIRSLLVFWKRLSGFRNSSVHPVSVRPGFLRFKIGKRPPPRQGQKRESPDEARKKAREHLLFSQRGKAYKTRSWRFGNGFLPSETLLCALCVGWRLWVENGGRAEQVVVELGEGGVRWKTVESEVEDGGV